MSLIAAVCKSSQLGGTTIFSHVASRVINGEGVKAGSWLISEAEDAMGGGGTDEDGGDIC